VDEAVVIGVALSLSSSAFVLQLLNERGEMATKFGSATLGILLMQVLPGPRRMLVCHLTSVVFELGCRPAVHLSDYLKESECMWRYDPVLSVRALLCRTLQSCHFWCCCRWWRAMM
jgi:hypothetical protein